MNTQNIFPENSQDSFKCHTPINRTEHAPISGNHPCQQAASLTVRRTVLFDPSMYTNTLASILKTAVMETIDAYSLVAFHGYTDGFAIKVTLKARYGVVIIYLDVHPDDNPRVIRLCRQYCSNYTAL
jgi:hypothetical protein